jgi:hypothetical protein
VALATVKASGEVHDANVLSGEAVAARDRAVAASLAPPAQVLVAVEAGHELAVPTTARSSPAGGGGRGWRPPRPSPPGRRPLVRADGSTTSLRELLRAPEFQLWLCVGAGDLGDAVALAERFAPALGARCSSSLIGPCPAPPDV